MTNDVMCEAEVLKIKEVKNELVKKRKKSKDQDYNDRLKICINKLEDIELLLNSMIK